MFPLRGAILLPRIALPLNIFEPRYLEMIDDVMSGNRLVGMVQPLQAVDDTESPAGKEAELRRLGGVGRITSYSETDDGRYLITLTGICRFAIAREIEVDRPYRRCLVDYAEFATDLTEGAGEDDVDRSHLLKVLKTYLDANELKADWQAIHRSSNEFLVNTLSMISPYGPEEKQALLEAATLKARAEILVALAEMQLAARDDGSGSTLQ
ncbi:MAG: LON peptidase substrate-binding domain-containing protein [Hyphomicrobiaceae bacterium]